ncbi:efflux RND transporter periplasmic adaptor subunit [Limnoglobus roseus]|uniref:Uncharacterized protein n=1 Tax=Limnoglobus roseus TaxID=2598579 RepID=A0A5C1A8C2_9BACT|nr:HlyD family efflux transporter periplasmic adaptor subunit [Limnoglobus roseus]QEL15461.1 hypothetical protein PX52LOC_02381 [Limnoglobus roseus]
MPPPARSLPRRRADLVVRPLGERGRYVVKDPRSGAYFQIGAHEQFLLDRLDGVQSPTAVRRAFEQEFGEPLTDDELDQFLDAAHAQSFLTTAGAAPPPVTDRPFGRATAALLGQATLDRYPVDDGQPPVAAPQAAPPPAAATPIKEGQSLLNWRLSLYDPDRLFARLVPHLGFVWTRGFVAVSATVVFAAAWVLVANWGELVTGFSSAARWQTVAVAWATVVFVTVFHEFAHGLTLKRYGGESHELGVLLLFFVPCLFCNVTDAWLIRERKKRLWVTLAGGYCDLCVWALAVFAWRLTPTDGLPNFIAFVALSVLGARVILNFNPFMKLDGYYLLSDWLEVPNLMHRGQDRAKAHLRRALWGAPPPDADPHGRAVTTYGLVSYAYALTFLSLMVYGLVRYLWAFVGPPGVAAAVGLAAVLFKSQLAGLASGEVRRMIFGRHSRTAVWLAVLGGLVAVGLVPVSDRAGGTFRVRAVARVELRAPAAGVVREVFFEEGDEVPAGAVVARLEVPDLASRQARKRAEAAEARAKLQLLEAGPNPAELAELTDRVARAERWHGLARADLDRDRAAHQEDLLRLAAAVARSEAEVKQAAATLDRLAALRKEKVVSAEDYDAAAGRAAVCREQLRQAEAEVRAVRTRGTAVSETELAKRAKEQADAIGTLAVLKAGPRKEEVAAARAHLASADEEARYLDELAGKLTVRTARGGLVTTARLRERVGRYVQEGELLVEVEDLAAMEIEVTLREGPAARVQPGQTVAVLPRAFPLHTLGGSVSRVAPAARRPGERPDAVSGTIAAPAAAAPSPDAEGQVVVCCTLADSDLRLRPGMTGYARIECGRRPLWAVVSDGVLRTVRIEFWR